MKNGIFIFTAILFFNSALTFNTFCQIQFEPYTITTSADGANSVFAIDVDDDDDIDVLSASRYDDKIAWYENDSFENFTTHVITASANDAWSVFAIDVDGDEDIDVLSASNGDDKIAWYENDGLENFTTHVITINAFNARSVFAIDVDGDDDIDVLSASGEDDKIAWYENDGSENFTTHVITASADGASSVYAIDVDGDEDIDVLSASWNDNIIAWYENDGFENFSTHVITINAFNARSVYAIDVDDDRDIDVISASSYDNKIAWYENDGSENFSTHVITASANRARSVFAIDVDGDDDIDVLSASAEDDKITWYEHLPNVSVNLTPFNPPIQIPAIGGSFDFNIEVANSDPSPVSIDIWTMVTLPNGSEYGPIINVPDFNAPTGWSGDRDRTQAVPGSASSGMYTYDAYVGVYPDTLFDEDHFDFEKLSTGNGAIVSDWSSWGEEFEDIGMSSESVIPSEFGLYPVYPNPFNPSTNINYQLPEASNVNLTVYDIMGQEVAKLVEGYKSAGTHNITFNAQDLVSGVYFVRLKAGGHVDTKKLILLK